MDYIQEYAKNSTGRLTLIKNSYCNNIGHLIKCAFECKYITEKQYTAIKLYLNGEKQKDIAEVLNITQPTASRLISNSINKVNRLIEFYNRVDKEC